MPGHLNQAEYSAQNAERPRVAARLLPDPRSRHVIALIRIQFSLQGVFEDSSRHAVCQKLQTSFGKRINSARLYRLEHRHAV